MNADHSHGSQLVGLFASVGGLIVSLLPMLEQGLRLASLAVGLAIGIRAWIRGRNKPPGAN